MRLYETDERLFDYVYDQLHDLSTEDCKGTTRDEIVAEVCEWVEGDGKLTDELGWRGRYLTMTDENHKQFASDLEEVVIGVLDQKSDPAWLIVNGPADDIIPSDLCDYVDLPQGSLYRQGRAALAHA